ncbi:flagellar hook-length control protein FliK [Roseibacterium sp. SDUM158017]|nr:flagellar hook-length control protein FliK [Roseibacterium sp. SDUM158017]
MAQTLAANLPGPAREPGTGAVEIALDPPELGRVRLSLVEVGGTMAVSITAERPETADLMRRHLEILAQEFARSGLDAPQVRIGVGSDGTGPPDGRREQADETGTGPAAPPGGEHPIAPGARVAPQRALDLRL